MFERFNTWLCTWLWKALTPDLVPDESQTAAPGLAPAMVAALGGAANVKFCQPLALTRLRVELRDAGLLQPEALRSAGVPALMRLPDGVFHLLLGVPQQSSSERLAGGTMA